MSWIAKILKSAVLLYAPAKLISAGVETVKREVKEETYKYVKVLLIYVTIVISALITLLFLSVFCALKLNEFFESTYLGFGVIALVYALTTIILLIANRKLIFETKDQKEEQPLVL